MEKQKDRAGRVGRAGVQEWALCHAPPLTLGSLPLAAGVGVNCFKCWGGRGAGARSGRGCVLGAQETLNAIAVDAMGPPLGAQETLPLAGNTSTSPFTLRIRTNTG